MPNQHTKPIVTDIAIVDALHQEYGNIQKAAKLLGISRKTIYDRMYANAEIKAARDNARQHIVDLAELKIVDEINKGNIAAIIYTLKTQGRDRGWDENRKTSHTSNRITINLIEGDGQQDNSRIIDIPPPKQLNE